MLCRIFEKSGSGPKNGEKCEALLKEEEWENDDQMDPLPIVDDEPLKEEFTFAIVTGGYIEAADLDEELDTSVAIGSADFSANSYYGSECSSHILGILKHSLMIKNHWKALVDFFGLKMTSLICPAIL